MQYLLCGAVIDEGSGDVFADEATVAIAKPKPEVPLWMRVAADWAGFLPLGAIISRMTKKLSGTRSNQNRGGSPCAN